MAHGLITRLGRKIEFKDHVYQPHYFSLCSFKTLNHPENDQEILNIPKLFYSRSRRFDPKTEAHNWCKKHENSFHILKIAGFRYFNFTYDHHKIYLIHKVIILLQKSTWSERLSVCDIDAYEILFKISATVFWTCSIYSFFLQNYQILCHFFYYLK